MEYSCQPYNEGQFSLTATNPKAWSRPGGAARHELAAWADKQNSHKLFNAWISCCVEASSSSWTARSTWPTPKRTAGIVAKMPCDRTDISYCDSWRRMWAKTLV